MLQKINDSDIANSLEAQGISIVFCEGLEPVFFNTEEDNHAFLILENKDLKVTLDPSLRVLLPFNKSGYSIRDRVETDKILNLFRHDERPIKIIHSDDILSLDQLSPQTALVGVTSDYGLAIELGFTLIQNKVAPFLKIHEGKERYYIRDKDELRVLNLSVDNQNEIQEMLEIFRTFNYEKDIS